MICYDARHPSVSVNTTSAPSTHRRPVFVDCHSRRAATHIPARNWPSMYSFFAQKWYGLLSFWALSWLREDALVRVVVGWYTEAVGGGGGVLVSNNCFFTTKHNNITFGILFQRLNANCTHAAAAVVVDKDRTKTGRRWGRWADGADVVFTDTRHP